MLYSCCTVCLEYHIVTAQCKLNSQYTGGHPVKVMPNWDYLSTLLWPVLTSTCFFTWLSLALSVMRELWNLLICIQYTKRIKRRGLWGFCAACIVHIGGVNHLQWFKDEKMCSDIVCRLSFRVNMIVDIQTAHCRRLLGVLMLWEKKKLDSLQVLWTWTVSKKKNKKSYGALKGTITFMQIWMQSSNEKLLRHQGPESF